MNLGNLFFSIVDISGERNNRASRTSAIKTMASGVGNIPTRFAARYRSSAYPRRNLHAGRGLFSALRRA